MKLIKWILVLNIIKVCLVVGCGVELPAEAETEKHKHQTSGVDEVGSDDHDHYEDDEKLHGLTKAFMIESIHFHECNADRIGLLVYETSSARFYLCSEKNIWAAVKVSSQPGSKDYIKFEKIGTKQQTKDHE